MFNRTAAAYAFATLLVACASKTQTATNSGSTSAAATATEGSTCQIGTSVGCIMRMAREGKKIGVAKSAIKMEDRGLRDTADREPQKTVGCDDCYSAESVKKNYPGWWTESDEADKAPAPAAAAASVADASRDAGEREVSATAINTAIKDQYPAVAKCLKSGGTFEGEAARVVVSLMLHPDGRRSDLQVEDSQIESAAFNKCLLKVFESKIEFPRPKGSSVEVIYPFTFTKRS